MYILICTRTRATVLSGRRLWQPVFSNMGWKKHIQAQGHYFEIKMNNKRKKKGLHLAYIFSFIYAVFFFRWKFSKDNIFVRLWVTVFDLIITKTGFQQITSIFKRGNVQIACTLGTLLFLLQWNVPNASFYFHLFLRKLKVVSMFKNNPTLLCKCRR